MLRSVVSPDRLSFLFYYTLQSSNLVASYSGGDDSDGDDTFDESKLVDFTKLMCLLCKRQFNSRETLQKHQQMSDLHKNNMETLRKSKSNKRNASAALRAGMNSNSGDTSLPAVSTHQLQYRDRAKERREKFGSTAPPAADSRISKPAPYEPVT